MSKSDFYNFPPSWNPGYATPDYVMAEPPGRGTFTTKWLPRGVINSLEPSFVADPGKKLLGRTDAGLGSLSGETIGGSSLSGSSITGSSLAGSTLLEDLGAQVYDLVPTSDDATAVDAALAAQRKKHAKIATAVVGVAAAALVYKLWKDNKRSRR